jgi:hypothetical protein
MAKPKQKPVKKAKPSASSKTVVGKHKPHISKNGTGKSNL